MSGAGSIARPPAPSAAACTASNRSRVENRRMLALVDLAPIDDLAEIEAVLQKMRERADPVAGRLRRSGHWRAVAALA